jgi:hypothetical protein
MFSKAIVLIFLTLGLSSSVAHAFPSQNRAQVQDPCNVRLLPAKEYFVISRRIQGVSTTTSTSPKSSNTAQNRKGGSSGKKGMSTSCWIHGIVLIASNKRHQPSPNWEPSKGGQSDKAGWRWKCSEQYHYSQRHKERRYPDRWQ